MEKVTNGNVMQQATIDRARAHFIDNSQTIQTCPVTDIISRISDKWSMHAIIILGKSGKMRFSELRKRIEGISQRMLTVTLRNLEQDGLLVRRVYAEVPPRVEYRLTVLGESLLIQLIGLSEWANQHMGQILVARQAFENKTNSVGDMVEA